MGKRFFIAVLALVLGFSVAPVANAAVEVGENLSLFGDMRLRVEMDDRESGDRERDRIRIRARLGAKYTVNDNWSMRIRLRTESDNNNSPHQTLGTSGGGNNGRSQDFGLDQAYIQYTRDSFNGKFGKKATDYWANSEVIFDEDTQHEGIQLG